jgi:hypothetical protein
MLEKAALKLVEKNNINMEALTKIFEAMVKQECSAAIGEIAAEYEEISRALTKKEKQESARWIG